MLQQDSVEENPFVIVILPGIRSTIFVTCCIRISCLLCELLCVKARSVQLQQLIGV